MEYTVTGADEVQRNIVALAQSMPTRIMGALWRESETVMAESKQLCPAMDGTLRASGHVTPPEHSGGAITATLGYGGAAAKYALAVHENPRAGKTGGWGKAGAQEIAFRWIKGRVVPIGAQRKKWAQVGQWKYLEQPFLAAVKGFNERILARVLKG